MTPDRIALETKVYDSLVSFNGVACWPVLQLAQMRQYLAEHLMADLAPEVEALHARIAELEAQAEKVAAFAAQRAEYVTSILNCHPDNKHDYYRWQGHAESRRQLSQSLGLPVAWPAETEPDTAPSQREAGAL
ncbi:hypothetical protein [Streptomyces sp. B27]|uniref:hypothetical protein n=1 Tax=Streptomyces sp. B27 TaxID=2485015 RepID=UPI000FDA81EB|nr:hypothetical protein [Streptomyces sp. B27]